MTFGLCICVQYLSTKLEGWLQVMKQHFLQSSPRGIRGVPSPKPTVQLTHHHTCVLDISPPTALLWRKRYLYRFQRLSNSSTSELPKCKMKVNAQRQQNFYKGPMSYLQCNFAERHVYTWECQQTSGFPGYEVGQQLNYCSHFENFKQKWRAWELAENPSLYFQKLMARSKGNTEAFQQHSKNSQVSHSK